MNEERLAQNQVEIDLLTAERKRLEHEQAEAEKTKFRHGDYGTAVVKLGGIGINWVFVSVRNPVPFRVKDYYYKESELTNIKIYGNTEDEIEQLREPYEDFEIGGVKFISGCSGELLEIRIQGRPGVLSPEQVGHIIPVLQRWLLKT